jgi:hypothetical protein
VASPPREPKSVVPRISLRLKVDRADTRLHHQKPEPPVHVKLTMIHLLHGTLAVARQVECPILAGVEHDLVTLDVAAGIATNESVGMQDPAILAGGLDLGGVGAPSDRIDQLAAVRCELPSEGVAGRDGEGVGVAAHRVAAVAAAVAHVEADVLDLDAADPDLKALRQVLRGDVAVADRGRLPVAVAHDGDQGIVIEGDFGVMFVNGVGRQVAVREGVIPDDHTLRAIAAVGPFGLQCDGARVQALVQANDPVRRILHRSALG